MKNKTDLEILTETLDKIRIKYVPISSRDRGIVLEVFYQHKSLDLLFDAEGKYIP